MNTQPNPQLVEALTNAPAAIDWREHLDTRMKILSAEVRRDYFTMRGPNYSRNSFTVALLLSGDSQLRHLANDNNIDLRAFDNIVGQVQQLILVNANKPAPAVKVAKVLRNLVGI